MTHKNPSSANTIADTSTFLGDDEFPARNMTQEQFIAEYINDYGKLPVGETLTEWKPATDEEANWVSERIRLEEKHG